MPTPPEGAQRSEDGLYWWDTDANAWQPVDGGSAADSSGTSPNAQAAADPAAAGSQWPPAGYPPDPADWTPEQLQYWFGNTQDASEDIAHAADVVQVQAIAELEGKSDEGIA